MAELFRKDVINAIRDLQKEKALEINSEEVNAMKANMLTRAYKDNKTKMLNYLNELEDLYDIKNGNARGIKTGIPCIDDSIGLMKNNELMILGGASGAGKSLIATNIMAKLIEEGKNVIYVGLEMGFGATFERLASIMHFIPPAFFRGKFESPKNIEQGYKMILDFVEKMRQNNHWQILTYNEFERPTCENIMATCKVIAKQLGWKKVDLIIIDYLQYIPTSQGKTEYESVNESIQQLKTFVVSEKIPVLALSSLNTDGSLKGSTNLKFTSDFVAMVNPIEGTDDRCLAVVKNRYGNFAKHRIQYSERLKVLDIEEMK